MWIVDWVLGVVILDDDCVGFVMVFGDFIFEGVVVDWMVFDVDGYLFYCWVVVWFFGDGLVDYDVVEFEVEVVM